MINLIDKMYNALKDDGVDIDSKDTLLLAKLLFEIDQKLNMIIKIIRDDIFSNEKEV